MLYFVYHPQDARCAFVLHLLSYAVQSKGLQGPFLILRTLDAASYLLYYNLCHGPVTLSVEDFIQRNSPLFRHCLGVPELKQGIKGGFYHIMRVG